MSEPTPHTSGDDDRERMREYLSADRAGDANPPDEDWRLSEETKADGRVGVARAKQIRAAQRRRDSGAELTPEEIELLASIHEPDEE